MLIANTLGRVADSIFGLPQSQLTTPLAWLGLVCYTLQIYFDFSGYSDMALGLMRLFGFRILENFNYPYISQSIREFWRRWHISLSNWFLDYLYVPLGGNREGTARAYRNLVIVFLLCGLWHGASWPFILWGIWHGLFLVAERAGLGRALERIGPLTHVYALLVVMGGWVLFRSSTLQGAIAYYAALLGLGTGDPVQRPLREFLDPLVATTIVIAVVGATPVVAASGRMARTSSPAHVRVSATPADRRHGLARPGADRRDGLPRGRHLQPVHLFPVLTRDGRSAPARRAAARARDTPVARPGADRDRGRPAASDGLGRSAGRRGDQVGEAARVARGHRWPG